MLRKNTLLTGLIIGVLFPVILFFILFNTFEALELLGGGDNTSSNFRERTAALLSIAINALFLNIYQKRRWYNVVRGIVIITVVLAFSWLIYYWKSFS